MTARVLMIVSAYTVLVVGTAAAVDEPTLLAGLLGTALLLMSSARAARRVVAALGTPALWIAGHRRGWETTAVARQCDPDAPGRIRARAPAAVPQAV